MTPQTHLGAHPELVGRPLSLGEGVASATLVGDARMAVDDRGLVHGGFVFGLADYAAMLAVNDPFVVLGAAEARFLAPVRVGDALVAHAEVSSAGGRKRSVSAQVQRGDTLVFQATFTCFVLDQHVLDRETP